MKHFDPEAIPGNVGTSTEPPALVHSGNAAKFMECTSKLYPALITDIMLEIINAVEGAGLTLDGTDRTQLFQAISLLSGTTADLKFSYDAPVLPWINPVGSIGETGSGGTQRANPDTVNLFTVCWNNIADAEAPVSGGRGASAAADFAALKNLTFPDPRGRVLAVNDNLGGFGVAGVLTGYREGILGTVLGRIGGEEAHQQALDELATHLHTFTAVITNTTAAGDTGAAVPSPQPPALANTSNAGNSADSNIVQPTLISNLHIKL